VGAQVRARRAASPTPSGRCNGKTRVGVFDNWWARVRRSICALLLLCAPLVAGACAATSYAGIPLAAGAADPELQALARRAQAGDGQAQLELGIRYEQGRGVPAQPALARSLYLSVVEGSRFQTQYVSVNGAVVPVNTAIGSGARLWPANFAEVRSYHPARIAALLRLCSLEQSPPRERGCDQDEVELLRQLAQFETGFRACRISSNWGGARFSPYSFWFNAIDFERRIETRRCMLSGPVPAAIPSDQSRRIWTMWLGLTRFTNCGEAARCDRDGVRRQFTSSLRAEVEDSLMWFAMRDAVRRRPSPEVQVGGWWWWGLCGLGSNETRIVRTDAEAKICALIELLVPGE
jgi:hypothetical protein